MEWTDSETRELVSLWPSHSTSQIAAYLHRPRSAVSAKAHRLRQEGLLPAETEKHFVVMPVQVRPRPAAKQLSIKWQLKSAPAKAHGAKLRSKQPVEQPTPSAKQPCPLTELTDRQCRWPLDLGHQVAILFCGGVTEKGQRYCRHHWRMARGGR